MTEPKARTSMHDATYRSRNLMFWLRLLAGAAVFFLCAVSVDLFDIDRYVRGFGNMVELISFGLPPNFEKAPKWIEPLWNTLAMSVVGTLLAVVISLFLAFLAASNTTPNRLTYRLTRGFLNLMRAIPELILGILLVASVGFGALPGALALALHSIGMVGKFFAESIEHVDIEPVEAVRAAGGSPLQVLMHGVLPQVLPQFADVAIYRWEYNFRASTVLGMIGAGGIGFPLYSALQVFNYEQVTSLLIVVLVMVAIVDHIGSRLRAALK